MITTNIDVADGLTNGAMGTIFNIVYNDSVKQIKAIFVKFDHTTIGENAIKNSTCNRSDLLIQYICIFQYISVYFRSCPVHSLQIMMSTNLIYFII